MKKIVFVLATAIGIIGPQPFAQAQGVFDMGTLTNTLSIDHVTQSERKRAQRQGSRRSASSKATISPNVSNKSSRLTLMEFPQSAALRKRNLANFVAGARRADPRNAAQIQQLFAAQDAFKLTDTWMKQYGLKSNRLADTLAVYLTTSWLVARGSNADPSKAQILGVRNQMARALTNAPAFKRVSGTGKQALADNLLLQSFLFSAYLDAAKVRSELKEQTRQMAVLSVRNSFGLDIQALKLTAQGLQA